MYCLSVCVNSSDAGAIGCSSFLKLGRGAMGEGIFGLARSTGVLRGDLEAEAFGVDDILLLSFANVILYNARPTQKYKVLG